MLCTKAELLREGIIFLIIHLFARAMLLMKKNENRRN